MKYPCTPDSSCFLIKPREEKSPQNQPTKCKSKYPPREPCAKYSYMVEWEHKSWENISTYPGYTQHIIMYNSAKKVLLEKWISKHDIEKYDKECCLSNPPWLHTHAYRRPVDHVSKEHICHSYHNHRNESKRDSIENTWSIYPPCSPNFLLQNISENEW